MSKIYIKIKNQKNHEYNEHFKIRKYFLKSFSFNYMSFCVYVTYMLGYN